MRKYNSIAVGILRPPHVFFYEIDCVKGDYSYRKKELIRCAKEYFDYFSIYRTMHGYHLIGYPYSKNGWAHFSGWHISDFTIKLKERWGRKNPQVLRISAKWNTRTGKEVSPEPKLVYGNFILTGIQKYKVIYYAK